MSNTDFVNPDHGRARAKSSNPSASLTTPSDRISTGGNSSQLQVFKWLLKLRCQTFWRRSFTIHSSIETEKAILPSRHPTEVISPEWWDTKTAKLGRLARSSPLHATDPFDDLSGELWRMFWKKVPKETLSTQQDHSYLRPGPCNISAPGWTITRNHLQETFNEFRQKSTKMKYYPQPSVSRQQNTTRQNNSKHQTTSPSFHNKTMLQPSWTLGSVTTKLFRFSGWACGTFTAAESAHTKNQNHWHTSPTFVLSPPPKDGQHQLPNAVRSCCLAKRRCPSWSSA